MYDTEDMVYGNASSDGAFDDVEMYDETGEPASSYNSDGSMGAAVILLGSLIALWALGAFLFKGSNQS